MKYPARFGAAMLATIFALAAAGSPANAQKRAERPWINTGLGPDARADLVIEAMTLNEKIQLIHGTGIPCDEPVTPENANSNRGVGYIPGIPRLGIPAINMADSAYGVRPSAVNGRYSTALPANLATAASWDLHAAYEYGALIGRELRAQGYNMSLGGGVNIAREPRNGRTFEYLGEDPILAGKMVASLIQGTRSADVITDIKHFAFNDQESGRMAVDAHIDERSARESDLLAFEIGVTEGEPDAVMCSYNRVNGNYACENDFLLNQVLKKDWKFQGFVVSDWNATHSTEKASKAGLDMEQPYDVFYGDRYKKAVESGKIPVAELDAHVHRVLRSLFDSGVIDHPHERVEIDPFSDLEIARKIEESSIVLLKNDEQILPLAPERWKSIAVIGAHSDVGMISGGGSAQVDPPGGNAIMPPGQRHTKWMKPVWFPTSPLRAIAARAPGAEVKYDAGTDPAAAAALAKSSDVAIVFAYKWSTETVDHYSLALSEDQNKLIAAVAAANPHTIVVLETGNAVSMPWVKAPAAIVEAWYAGSDGANALANVLFGAINPSGKLPITFPISDEDLPRKTVKQPPVESQDTPAFWNLPKSERGKGLPPFDENYSEGVKVGYKWFDAENRPVLFPFGYGLSYTTFGYSDLKVSGGDMVTVSFTLTNTGQRLGAEIAEVYAALPAAANEPPKRLVGWSKVTLAPGEKKTVTVEVDRKFLSIFDVGKNAWSLLPGDYTLLVGGSSRDFPLKTKINLK